MRRLALLLIWSAGPAWAQALCSGSPDIAVELRSIRLLLEKNQKSVAAQESLRLRSVRLASLYSRLDQATEERENEETHLGGLREALAVADQENRLGIEQNVRASERRLSQIVQRLATLQRLIDDEEKQYNQLILRIDSDERQ